MRQWNASPICAYFRWAPIIGYELIFQEIQYLFPLSLWIQITIHPLSTDGAIVILVFQRVVCNGVFIIFNFKLVY